MNIFIVTAGTRGDIQPYVALGYALQQRGHHATICTCAQFEPFIKSYGLSYGFMHDDFLQLVDSEAGRKAIDNSGNFSGLLVSLFRLLKQARAINHRMLRDTWHAAQKAKPDIIIFHPKILAGVHIAEKLQRPALLATPVPAIVPSREFPALGFPKLPLGGWYNKLSYWLLFKGYHQYDHLINQFRQTELGLPKYSKSLSPLQMPDRTPVPVLHAYSKHVGPTAADWPATACVTGYWFLPQPDNWQPTTELQTFLDSGAPPVYVGFGSMSGRRPWQVLQTVIAALQKAGIRGIVAGKAWTSLQIDLPDTILLLDQVPHDGLFPRVSAVVHHGGAGTTAAGIRAARPTLICPFILDQFYWGERIYKLGVGPAPLPQKKLNTERLATALDELTTQAHFRKNAQHLADKLRHEEGLANAISIIESRCPAGVSD